MTRTLTLSEERKNTVINATKEVLGKGGLVVFPSDTVYGLLVDATCDEAVDKLIAFKNRPPGKAISVFVRDMQMIKQHAHLSRQQESLLSSLLPGPFTVVLPSKHTLVSKLESEKGTIGLRIPDYYYVQQLINQYGKPVTATSANLGGSNPHYSIDSLLHQIPKKKAELIDLIVDAGKLPRNKPSTVIDLTGEELHILRQGEIVFEREDHYISRSAEQTKKIGQFILDKMLKRKMSKPIVFIMKGDLGAGKTEMTRGIAEYFGINRIVSPTFVVYYEYDIPKHTEKAYAASFDKFVHADLYNVADEREFEDLGLETYLDSPSVIVIEWGEKLGRLYEKFRQKALTVFIEIQHKSDQERIVDVKE